MRNATPGGTFTDNDVIVPQDVIVEAECCGDTALTCVVSYLVWVRFPHWTLNPYFPGKALQHKVCRPTDAR